MVNYSSESGRIRGSIHIRSKSANKLPRMSITAPSRSPPHHHIDVETLNSLQEQLAQPRPIEEKLGNKRAAEQIGKLKAQDRDQGVDGVAQRVQPDHPPLWDPTGPRRLDVFLPQHIQEIAARNPLQPGKAGDAQGQRGQEQVAAQIQQLFPQTKLGKINTGHPPYRQPAHVLGHN